MRLPAGFGFASAALCWPGLRSHWGRAPGPVNPNYEHYERTYKEQEANRWRSNNKDYPPRKAYEPSCNGSDKRDDCLLLWRSTRAAETQANAAIDQVLWSKAAFWFLVFTFVATSLAAYFAYQAASATHLGALADQNSAAAADKTLKEMETTNKRQLRAYVCMETVRVKDLLGAAPPVFEVTFKNSGQTPAHNFVVACFVVPSPFPLHGTLAPLETLTLPSVSIVNPNGTNSVPLPAPRALNPMEQYLVTTRIMTFYVYGEATYVDVFGDKQWTRFRAMCAGATGIINGEMINCPEGNEMS